jgi:hypothetical protein
VTNVNVTQENIDVGIAMNPQCCPIAYAMDSVLAKEVTVKVYGRRMELTRHFASDGTKKIMRRMPHEAANFVDRFDSQSKDERVVPFSFKINIPKCYLKNEDV